MTNDFLFWRNKALNFKKKYTISVAVHNELELTKKFLTNLYTTTKDFQLIIINNGSEKNVSNYFNELERKVPNVAIINSKINTGFGKAHNAALTMASTPYFVVVNNDVFFYNGWLEELISLIDDNTPIACPKNCAMSLGSEGIGSNSTRVDYAEGSCFVIKTDIAKMFDLFDADYYKIAYCEDADFSLRLRAKNYNIAVGPKEVLHLRAATSSKKLNFDLEGHWVNNHLAFRNRWDLYLKHNILRPNILVRRDVARGDVLLATPLLRELKKHYPASTINFATHYPEVLQCNPNVDRLIDLKVQQCSGSFHQIIDLNNAYELKPYQHVIEAYANQAKIKITDYRLDMYATPVDIDLPKNYIVIDLGDTWPSRSYPKQKYMQIAERLDKEIVFLGQSWFDPNRDYNFINRTTINEAAYIISKAKGFIGNDCFLAHVAQAFNIPSVVFFGAIDANKRLTNKNAIGLTNNECECLGCHHKHVPPVYESSCLRTKEKNKCLDISIEEVLNACRNVKM